MSVFATVRQKQLWWLTVMQQAVALLSDSTYSLLCFVLERADAFASSASAKVDQHGHGRHGHDASTLLEEQRRLLLGLSWRFVC